MSRVAVHAKAATMKKWKITRFHTSMTGTCVTTSRTYCRTIELFAMWCEGTGVGIHPADVTRDDISKYLVFRMGQGVSIQTRNKELIAIRKYYRWCLKETVYLVKVDPTRGLYHGKAAQRLPRPLEKDEALALCLLYVEEHSRRTNALNRLIVEILYGSGLRSAEICSLTLESISTDKSTLRFVGKGNKERLAPMSQPCIEALKVWMSYRGLHDGALLLTEKGTPIAGHHIRIMIKDRALRAGIIADVHPHKLRHSFATHMLENGADCYSIQTLLGHSDPSTVDRYAQVSITLLRAAYATCHPGDRTYTRDKLLSEYRECLPSF